MTTSTPIKPFSGRPAPPARALCAALSVCLALPAALVLPPLAVSANMQEPVTQWAGCSGFASPAAPASAYTVDLSFYRPDASDKADPRNAYDAAVQPDYFTHVADKFSIFMRSASQGAQYGTSPIDSFPDASGSRQIKDTINSAALSGAQMLPGQIYAFKAVPSHTHSDQIPPSVPGGAYTPGPATLNPAVAPAEAYFLTDLSVSASGTPDTLTVAWDNPKLDGRQLFSGYKLYYGLYAGSSTAVNWSAREVSVSEATLLANGRLQYIIAGITPPLSVGKYYSVKVEPMVTTGSVPNPQTLRPVQDGSANSGGAVQPMTVNGVAYQALGFTSPATREYRVNGVYISPGLFIAQEGSDNVRLYWPPFTDAAKIEVMTSTVAPDTSKTPPMFQGGRVVGSLTGTAAASANYWLLPRPSAVSFYQLKITDQAGGVMYSDIVSFDPTSDDFSPYVPTVFQFDPAQTPAGQTAGALKLDAAWRAFTRPIYGPGDVPIPGGADTTLDTMLSYDVYITDDIRNFDRADFKPTYPLIPAASLTPDYNYPDPADPAGQAPLTAYERSFSLYTADQGGGLVSLPVADNKIYYIKIVAVRSTVQAQESQPAYASCYYPVTGGLNARPVMITAPPFKVQAVAPDSITGQWSSRWAEIFNPADQTWYPQFGLTGDGGIIYGDKAAANPSVAVYADLSDPILFASAPKDPTAAQLEAAAKAGLARKLGPAYDPLTMVIRAQDLSGCAYKAHVVRYDDMTAGGGTYESYLNGLMADQNAWAPIAPAVAPADPTRFSYVFKNADQPKGSVKPNTAYVIFLLPYNTAGALASYYPAYITATTRDAPGSLAVTPTVPALTPVSRTDSSLTVSWQYSPALDYNLYFSDTLTDYPDGGASVPADAIRADGVLSAAADPDLQYISYTINGLFPGTRYYIWAGSASGDKKSAMSNPIDMKTDGIAAPAPPRGLGLAAADDLVAYNAVNGTDLKPVDNTYMIVEFMRDFNDIINDVVKGGGGKAAGSGAATGAGFTGEYLPFDAVSNILMTKFSGLTPNKQYYIRAKTILTVTKGAGTGAAGGGSVRAYSYAVELSPDPDFLDSYTVYIPQEPPADVPGQTVSGESDWCQAIYLYTGQWSGEYDADKTPGMYPLPPDNFEINYDADTETLTYRFRGSRTDAAGNADNGADQRLISRLVNSRAYALKVDMSTYNNYNISNRVVTLPYSIVKALDQRGISFDLNAAGVAVSFPAGAFNTAEVKSLADFGVNAAVSVSLATNAPGAPALNNREAYLTRPRTLSVSVITPKRAVALPRLASYATVTMKLDNRYDVAQKHVAAYIATPDSGGWRVAPSVYDSSQGTLTIKTPAVATYASIAANAAQADLNDPSADAFYNVSSKIRLNGLNSYNPSAAITAGQFNSIVAAAASRRAAADVNGGLAGSDRAALDKARLLVPGADAQNVQRQAGIASMVRLYELLTGTAIKGYPTAASSGLTDIGRVQDAYKTAALKAEAAGLISGSVSPAANMTMGDFMTMLSACLGE